MRYWKPLVYTASPHTCSLLVLDFISYLSQHSPGSCCLGWMVCKMKSLCYARFRRRFHFENLSLSTYPLPSLQFQPCVKDDSALVSYTVGDRKKKGGKDKVMGSSHLAPAENVSLGNLDNSFLVGLCIPERITVSNSTIQKGGII